MKKKMIWVTVAIAIFTGPQALAQESLIDHLIDACEGDLQKYCSQVTPGEGRLLHCMAAHEDKISGQCEYAFYQTAALLEQLSVAIAYVAQECETEIETLCRDVELGEGRILACLDEHAEEVGASCKKAVADTVGE
jgi:Cysteine rich repeat